MNKKQAQVTEAQLKAEQLTLNRLKKQYKEALNDVNGKIGALLARSDNENLETIIYQVQYQTALKKQIKGVLDQLETKQFNTISEYLTEAYDNGFLGTLYDLHNQGIPLIFPINQKQALDALTVDSKLSKPLYNSLGESVAKLKHNLQRNLSRGIAQGASYSEISKMIAKEMVGDYSHFRGGAYYFAERITRTEGHRIQNQAALDAQFKAQEKGADIVKQWDATLDDRTRPDHAEADGQIRKLDEDFLVGGEWLPAPGIGGSAGNVINCRCACLQRATWALDEDELETLKERAEFYGLDKTADFEDFKKKYLKASDNELQIIKNQWEIYQDQMHDLEEKYGGYSEFVSQATQEELKAWNKAYDEQWKYTQKLSSEGVDINGLYKEYESKKEQEKKDEQDFYNKSQSEWNSLEEKKDKILEKYGGDKNAFVATASMDDLSEFLDYDNQQKKIIKDLTENGFPNANKAQFQDEYEKAKTEQGEAEKNVEQLEKEYEKWKEDNGFNDLDIDFLKEEGSELANEDYDSLSYVDKNIVDQYVKIINYEDEIEKAKQKQLQIPEKIEIISPTEKLEKAEQELQQWLTDHHYDESYIQKLEDYAKKAKSMDADQLAKSKSYQKILAQYDELQQLQTNIENAKNEVLAETEKNIIQQQLEQAEKDLENWIANSDYDKSELNDLLIDGENLKKMPWSDLTNWDKTIIGDAEDYKHLKEKVDSLKKQLETPKDEPNGKGKSVNPSDHEELINHAKDFRSDTSSADRYHKVANFDWDKWNNELSEKEREGIRKYTGSNYVEMNSALRNNRYETSYEKKTIDDCTAGLEKWRIAEDVVTYRGMGGASSFSAWTGIDVNDLSKKSVQDALIGTRLTEKGFMSTGVSTGSAWSGIRLKVYIPAGSKGMYVDPISKNSGEMELLLQRNSTFEVKEIDSDPSTGHIKQVTLVLVDQTL